MALERLLQETVRSKKLENGFKDSSETSAHSQVKEKIARMVKQNRKLEQMVITKEKHTKKDVINIVTNIRKDKIPKKVKEVIGDGVLRLEEENN